MKARAGLFATLLLLGSLAGCFAGSSENPRSAHDGTHPLLIINHRAALSPLRVAIWSDTTHTLLKAMEIPTMPANSRWEDEFNDTRPAEGFLVKVIEPDDETTFQAVRGPEGSSKLSIILTDNVVIIGDDEVTYG